MQISNTTQKNRRIDFLATLGMRAAAAITIVIMAWILGYILFKGFVSIQDKGYQVLPNLETSMITEAYPQVPLSIIVHDEVRIDQMTQEELTSAFTKRRQGNWGDITGQNLKIMPFLYTQNDSDVYRASMRLLANTEAEVGSYVSYVRTPAEMISQIAVVPGSIGIVPTSLISTGVPQGVQVVGIRRYSLIVHDAVTSIVDNHQLREIPDSELPALFSGETVTWDLLGGPAIPIVPIWFDSSRPDLAVIHDAFKPEGSSGSVTVTDLTTMRDTIRSTPGSFGIVPFLFAQDEGLSTLTTVSHQVRPNLTWHFIVEPPARSGSWGGISSIIINTLVLIVFTILFSAPIGIFAAIYLVEYAVENRLVRILRLGTETLAGIPSIVFGLFGFILFVNTLGWGIGFISATLTVTLMILPTIIRTSEEALKSVPAGYRDASLALGGTKLQTVFRVVLPAATPGILTGVILAVGRTVGETAVLLYTLGSNYELVSGPTSSARVLSLHIYSLFSEAISFDRSFATATVLIFIILIVNISASRIVKGSQRKQRSTL